MHRCAVLSLIALLAIPAAFAATEGGTPPVPLPLFPQNNWWNIDISNAPVDGNSATFITFIGGAGRAAHPDYGGDVGDGTIYGFPFIVVDGSQPEVTVAFDPDAADESDGNGVPFYPIPNEAITTSGWIEYGPPGNVDARPDADRHMLIIDSSNNTLYELYNVWYNGTGWEAYSGAFFNMHTNNRRPNTWTSADAAGLAILPGLVRYDEVFGPDPINHAFRMTVQQSNGYVYPASHQAGTTAGALPMGARLRLKASTNISTYPAEIQRIFNAMKRYGLIVADNGSNLYVSGTYDNRWDMDVMNFYFNKLHASDFEVVQLGWQPATTFIMAVPTAVGGGDLTSVTITAFDTNYNIATGYRGTIHFTSSDGAATLPVDYAFTAGDNGAHTFNVTLRTPGSQWIRIADNAAPTSTAEKSVIVGPPTPGSFVATATSSTQVGLSWSASSGATQYEIFRGTTPANIALINTTASLTFSDGSRIPATTYIYKVRAIDAASRYSGYATDIATTVMFTDDPLVVASTAVKAVHLTELRTAINAMRTAAGLGAMTVTDPSPSGLQVKAVHVIEARTALNAARSALGLAALTYTDPTVTAHSTTIKAAHFTELRNGLK